MEHLIGHIGHRTVEQRLDFYLKILYRRSLIMYNHSLRVADIARQLCNFLGVDQEEKEVIYIGSKYHDIGKIMVPEEILKKNGQLSVEERTEVEKHVRYAYDIMSFIPGVDNRIIEIAMYHHEKLNGSGYPKGLKGDRIPFYVRIVSVADVIAALEEDRYHRYGKPIEEIVEYLERGVDEGEYDRDVVEAYKHWVVKAKE